jgi:hypothetical protein
MFCSSFGGSTSIMPNLLLHPLTGACNGVVLPLIALSQRASEEMSGLGK